MLDAEELSRIGWFQGRRRDEAQWTKTRIRGEVLIVDEDGLRKLIDRIARKKLGLYGEEALERIEKGQAGDNYVWDDLSGLATMLR